MIAIPAIRAADIFVAPNGSDTGNGSAAAPFREIRKALTVIVPGDRVLVADGNYKGFDAVSIGSASAAPTIIKAMGSGAIITPTTDRRSNDKYNMQCWLCVNFVIDGLRTFNAAMAGLRIIECTNVTMRNGVFGNSQYWGIVTSHSDDIVLEYNDCYGSANEHGIYVANSGDRPVVRGNRLHDNAGSGLRSNGDVIQGGDGIITGALYENNIIYNNCVLGGAAMNLDGLQDGTVRNNLIYNNHSTGIALFKGGGAAGPKGMRVLNNTIILPADGRYNMRITDVIGPLTVRNNIMYNANTAKGPFSWTTPGDAALTDSDYNAFGGGRFVSTDGEASRISMDAWIAAGHESHSIPVVTLPGLVVNSAANDYQLAAGSPAIDQGVTLIDVPTDILKVSRPQGGVADIGAYEFAPYEQWKAAHGIPALTPAISDSDGDGILMLMEYTLDLDPHFSSVAGLPVVQISADRLELSYTKARPEIQHVVEVSTDLRTWSAEGVDQGGAGPTVIATVPLSASGSQRFLRLRATLP